MNNPRRHPARFRTAAVNILGPIAVFLLLLGAAEGMARLFYVPGAARNADSPFRFDPERWYSLKPGFVGEHNQRLLITNSRGYRDREIPVAKPKGTLRILLLGDSVSFGDGVEEPDVYANHLERMLTARFGAPVEIINTALPGNSPYQEYVDLERALDFQPDLVLYQFNLNDVVEPYWTRTALGGAGVDYHGIPDAPGIDYLLGTHSALYLFVKDMASRLRFGDLSGEHVADVAKVREEYHIERLYDEPLSEELRGAWNDAFGWMRMMKTRAARDGIPFAMFVSPTDMQMTKPGLDLPDRMLRQFAEEEGFPLMDVTPLLKQRYAERNTLPLEQATEEQVRNFWFTYFLDFHHPNALGHRLYAEALVEPLEQALKRSP